MKTPTELFDGLPAPVAAELEKISEIAGYLWAHGWAERNAGNISVRLTGLLPEDFSMGCSEIFPCCQLPLEAAGEVYFITGAGARLRDLTHRPGLVSCIIRITGSANGYHLLWGGDLPGFRPTSELISHIRIQCFLQEHKPEHRAVLHTHCTELILLSHHPLFANEAGLNHSLWKLCPEIRVFVPNGIHCTPYAVSGSGVLADLSLKGLKNRDIILWEKHGVLSTGTDIIEAFDFLDVANKGAKMLLMAWAAGFEPKGLSDTELDELERLFLQGS